MGAEAACTVLFKRTTVSGRARLETDVVQFRGGDLKLSIPFGRITGLSVRSGRLRVSWPDGTATFALGDAAPKWAAKIANPPTRLTKLGVKAGQRISIVALDDQAFLDEIEAAGATVIVGRPADGSDIIFWGAAGAGDLKRMAALRKSLAPAGALWVIRPKGRPEISEGAVMAAGRNAGLVDVKVASYSATHTAEKFVIPVANRPGRK